MKRYAVLGFTCCAVSGMLQGIYCESWFGLLVVIIAIIGGGLITAR